MKVSVVTWETERKVVRITERGMSTLTVTKRATHFDWAAIINLPDINLSSAEAKAMIKALELAAKVAGYLDDLEPDEARDAILGLPTMPYDGWRPMPRAGRTEN